jgi:hypothetical protein
VLAKCNNQPNRQMGYVGEMQLSTSKQINNNYGNLTCNCDMPTIKLKTLTILAVCLSPSWYVQCIKMGNGI